MTAATGMDLLVTGFGPFPHVRVNPTAALARAVADRLARAGMDARALVLETSYSGGLPALRRHLDETRPRAVLMLGLAARARFVRVELFARGRSSRLHADARLSLGLEVPPSGQDAETGPEAATLFMEELLASVESLTELADMHGARTLADLVYLQQAILKGGFIDHYPGESKVLEVVKELPSHQRWVGFIELAKD